MSKVREKLLTDTFDVKGIWFLPESDMSKEGIKGTLRYSPSRITLELIGTFNQVSPFTNAETPHELTIYGFSEVGEWFTLLDCLPTQARMSAPGFDIVTYIVNQFYAGTKIVQSEDAVENAIFSFTNLDAWLDYNIIERCEEWNTKKTTFTIDLALPSCDRKKLDIPSKSLVLNKEIGYSLKFPKEYFLNEKTEIIVSRFYRFSSATVALLSPTHLLESMQQFRRLLSLLIGSAMYFSYIELNFPSVKETIPNGKELEIKQHCKLFFNQVGDMFKVKRLTRIRQNSMLIKRHDLGEKMSSVFNYWFDEQEKLSEITSPYISDLYFPSYIESKYLNVVRGLETYHRFFIENKAEEQVSSSHNDELNRECEQILSFINENISESNREYFSKRVCYEGEQNFRQRLKTLLGLTPAKLSVHLFGEMNSKDRNKLISTIIDTRNYFTHRDDKTRYINAVSDHIQLDNLTEQLSSLLQFFCLTQLGIDPDTVVQRIKDFS